MKSPSERRISTQKLVYSVLDQCGAGLKSLRGSWLYGDFHLSPDGRKSFSDLDLVIPGATDFQIEYAKQVIADCLGPALHLHVAIHPIESMTSMTIEDSRLLLLGEYLISMLRKVPTGYMSMDYVRAKILLLFLRKSRDERYGAVVDRLGQRVVGRAGSVKFGMSEDFSAEEMVHCLRSEPSEATDRLVELCLAASPRQPFLDAWYRDLDRANSINPWLKSHVATRVMEALAR